MAKKEVVKQSFLQLPKQTTTAQQGLLVGLVLLVCLLTWNAYQPALENGFTNWDDPKYVAENEDLDLSKDEHWHNLLTATYLANYHPLTMLSLAMDNDEKWPKRDPKPFHKTNVLLHLANLILVFLLVYQLSRRRWFVAVLAALWFGIHPMHVESVAWIAERKDVLYTLFFLGSLLCYWQYLSSKKVLWFVIATALFVLSVLSKAMAIVIPIIMLLLDYYSKRQWSPRLIWEKVGLLLFSIAMGLYAVEVQKADAINDFDTFTILQRLMFASYGFLMYLYKFFWPGNFSTFYPYPTLVQGDELAWYWKFLPLLVALLMGIVVWSMRKTRLIAFGFGFFAVSLVMVIQFISVGAAIMADRYTYVAYIPLLFMLGMGISYLLESKKQSLKFLGYTLGGVCICATIPFYSMTQGQIKVWENPETLWTQVIDDYPMRVEVAYKNRGNYRAKELKRYDDALGDYEALQKMRTKDPKVYSNLGNLYGLRGEFDRALAAYDKAVSMSEEPQYDVMMNRGVTLTKMKEYQQALEQFEAAKKIKGQNYQLEANLSYAYLETKRFDQAIASYDWLISQNPKDHNSIYLKGYCQQQLKNDTEALINFETALKMNPKNPQGWYFAALSADRLGDLKKARQYGAKALQLEVAIPAIHKKRWGL